MQLKAQVVPLHRYAPQEVSIAAGQLPLPSQLAGAVCEQLPEAQLQDSAMHALLG